MKYTVLLCFLFLTSCATGYVVQSAGVKTYKSGSCEVEVYNSLSYAQQFGEVNEVCTITGSSAFSFDHSLDGAIKKNLSRVCSCGATKAYIASSSQDKSLGVKGATNIVLVAFR